MSTPRTPPVTSPSPPSPSLPQCNGHNLCDEVQEELHVGDPVSAETLQSDVPVVRPQSPHRLRRHHPRHHRSCTTPGSIDEAIARAKRDSLCTPDFIPKSKGRSRTVNGVVGSGYIMLSGVKHTLRSDLPHMPKRSVCVIYYKFSTKKNINRKKGRVQG